MEGARNRRAIALVQNWRDATRRRASLRGALADARAAFAAAFAHEREQRRFFLWLPVAGMAGVLLYMVADQEPVLWMPAGLTIGCALAAFFARHQPVGFAIAIAGFAFFAGFLSAALRTSRVAAPVIDHIRIATVTGFVEEIDFRREGARFILRVDMIDGLEAAATPRRIRLTSRRTPSLAAGQYISLKARLLPPARASLPGGYSFARDAYFARLGGVGSALGRIEVLTPPQGPGVVPDVMMALDRTRNALAARVFEIVGGDAGAVAVAMVTGKRDLLSEESRELIREAGIFHIITISGVQMTLVAAILFWTFRAILALVPGLSVRFSIKKSAAGAAMLGAIIYDIATGSRVGTERALFMTLIMLGAIMLDRRALTMRNLALAATAIIIFEPEAILGASFQLSFAAVSALVAVYEARIARFAQARANGDTLLLSGQGGFDRNRAWLEKFADGTKHALVSTFFASAATASFMAAQFHELSPYVMIGNPMTLAIIEFFAVPGALIGTLLYPLGLDAPVWLYVGAGIRFILWLAGYIASAPGATAHLTQFAPWALVFLSLAVLCMVIWKTWLMRLTALPVFLIGLYGATHGDRFDMMIAPTGDAVAVRTADGRWA